MMDSNERCGRSRNEDSNLVNGIVCWIEFPELLERRLLKWEQECWRYSLVDGVFGNVN